MKTKKTITELVDDFDGTPGAQTVTFAFEGKRYEIELGEANRAEFESLLNPYIKKARRLGGSSRKRSSSTPGQSTQVRAWAQENGIKVSPTGKIARSVVEQYKAAH